MESRKRYAYIDVLKMLGVLIVLNSHFDTLYPISYLAVGGAIGNGLFFITSGFLCWPIKSGGFPWWFGRKVLRIYIPTLIAAAVSLFTTRKGLLTPGNAFFIFVWPTVFWFIGAIILFYIIYYLLRNVTTDRQFGIMFGVLAIAYVAIYIGLVDTSVWSVEAYFAVDENGLGILPVNSVPAICVKLIYSFVMMMAGKYLRIHMDSVKYHPCKYFIIAVAGVICNYGMKFFMFLRPNPFMHFQFIPQIAAVVTVISMMQWGLSLEKKNVFERHGKTLSIVNWVSALSLEYYVVQGIFISYAKEIIFPLNIIFACIATTVCSWTLHKLSNIIERSLIHHCEREK